MIKIICIGNQKEPYLKEATKEYLKRLTKYTNIEIIELNEINNLPIEQSLEKEAQLIKHYISIKDYVITLEIVGKELTSEELSKKIEDTLMINPNLTFIVGSSNGLSKSIKNRSNFQLSFSKLTFPHQLFRVILLEQIYRSFKIINNETYHK